MAHRFVAPSRTGQYWRLIFIVLVLPRGSDKSNAKVSSRLALLNGAFPSNPLQGKPGTPNSGLCRIRN